MHPAIVRLALACALIGCLFSGPATALDANSADAGSQAPITVTGERLQLLGAAMSASEGVVADEELQLAPVYRPGQLLEAVPGLIVTLHSGEGKANQYLMRGYNLDHGTDLETYVDGMPINQPTHAHGQGYTDLNFMIPELVDRLSFTKGPYYANVGDFGAVGSLRLSYRDALPAQVAVTIGTLGYQRVLAGGSQAFGDGSLLAAAEVQHYNGPFATPDDARKENGVLRYSVGDGTNGYSLTGMVYHQVWTNTTDIPIRAIAARLVADRFGSLDPGDGGHALRASLSFQDHATIGDGQLASSAYFIANELHIFNDFTHFLVDPVHGDQEEQFENRHVTGGTVAYSRPLPLGALRNEFVAGGVLRHDRLEVGRNPSERQVPLAVTEAPGDPASYFDDDQVSLFSAGAYLQVTTHWLPTLRTVLALREDYQRGTDTDLLATLHLAAGYSNGGTAAQSLVQPKGSLIYSPNDMLEFYLAAGRGFHSADLRGVNQDRSVDLGLPHSPLLAKQEGQEVGLRATPRQDLAFTLALFNLWQRSETIINPDIGQDSAGPPSRRYGYEVNMTWQANRWLELYGSYSADHTRFTHPFDDGTGHLGEYITDAPVATGSLALYVRDLGRWSGGLAFRYLGGYPLSSGPCVDAAAVHDFPHVATSCATAPTARGQVNARGFGELNLDLHCAVAERWIASLGIYNVLNTHSAAAAFWYVDRLRSEAGAYPDGRADVHEHPLEPLMARLTVSRNF